MTNESPPTQGTTFFSAVWGAPWEDVAPLARVLEVTLAPEADTITPAHSHALWKKLSYLGSNDLAYLLRGFEGVDYPEIVRDVCKHLKLEGLQPGEQERAVELNEQSVLAKIFADAWGHLDAEQRLEFLRELNLEEGHGSLVGASVAAAVLDGRAGPFALYKLSRIVSNSVARALPGRRWTPARRKTVQAVVLVASLRQAQRTALAETALAGAGTIAKAAAASAGSPKKARRRAVEQAVEQLARRRGTKKKAASKPAAPPKKVAKKRAAKKAPKKPAAKKATKKKAAKKKRSRHSA
ncbi:MAG TPA: hypothetical protein VJU61_14750 [Polyangiaceae bacterium]|nr:hypothetical protein [Polyangiaceae bacterium]